MCTCQAAKSRVGTWWKNKGWAPPPLRVTSPFKTVRLCYLDEEGQGCERTKDRVTVERKRRKIAVASGEYMCPAHSSLIMEPLHWIVSPLLPSLGATSSQPLFQLLHPTSSWVFSLHTWTQSALGPLLDHWALVLCIGSPPSHLGNPVYMGMGERNATERLFSMAA